MNLNAIGIVFSNMHDEEMHEITNCRTMGALPFGGRYRLIDFALSNMHNSGVTSVGIIAKSNYQSLLEHLGSGKEWDLSRKREGLFIFPPFGRLSSGIYQNKIEALNGIMTYIKKSKNDYVLITDCDIICNMNWEIPLQYHIKRKADITVICFKPDKYKELKNETLYKVSENGFVTDILLNQEVSGSNLMGTNMWITQKNFLMSMIQDAIAHNLQNIEKDILQKKLGIYKIAAWEFNGYMKKTNSIYDFFWANMDILNSEIRNELFYKYGPIYTKVLDMVPTRYAPTAMVHNSLVADGCVIEGKVENSILFRGVTIGKDSIVKNSILMKDTKVLDEVTLDFVLSDKGVTFQNRRSLMGYEKRPIYMNKGSIV